MSQTANKVARVILLLAIVFCLIHGRVFSQDKKLKVISDRAEVHLDPDSQSPVIAELERGTVLSLGSDRKIRLNWYYVYFISPTSGSTRSGYIREPAVEKLFESLKIIDITGAIEKEKTASRSSDYESFQEAAEWGMSKQEVLKVEGRPFRKGKEGEWEFLEYRRKVMDRACSVIYFFAEDRLVRARFSLEEEYPGKNDYVDDYHKIKTLLVQRYGEPKADSVTWQDPSCNDDNLNRTSPPGDEALLEMNSQWFLLDTDTELILTLVEVNNRMQISAECLSHRFKEAVRK